MPTKAQSEQRAKALKPFTSEQSREKAKENGKKGGIASGEAKREKKLFKEEILKRMSEKDWDEMILNLIEKSKGDIKYTEFIRDTIGQKPVQDVNIQGETEVTIKVALTKD